MKNFLLILFIFQWLLITPGKAAFPVWFNPNKARILATQQFFRNIEKFSINFYRLSEIKYRKEVLENGTEIIKIDILFTTPTCNREANFEFLDYLCDSKSCYSTPLIVGDCIKQLR
jgi:hypothetical protein